MADLVSSIALMILPIALGVRCIVANVGVVAIIGGDGSIRGVGCGR